MTTRTESFLAEIHAEFPDFAIKKKRTSVLQRSIHVALAALTLGGQRSYLTRYHTVLWGTLWVPDAWDAMTDDDRYILLRHERPMRRLTLEIVFLPSTPSLALASAPTSTCPLG